MAPFHRGSLVMTKAGWPPHRAKGTSKAKVDEGRPVLLAKLVGLSGLEPLTSRLSGVCSNHLSYRPSEKQTAFRRQFLVTGQLWAYRSG